MDSLRGGATTTGANCPRCGAAYGKSASGGDWGEAVCEQCRPLFPLSLLKATVDDPVSYALRLRTGEIIPFEGAEVHGDYVRLSGPGDANGDRPLEADSNADLSHRFRRGLDVRVQDVVWCADAPDGS